MLPLFAPGYVSPKPTTVPVMFTSLETVGKQANWMVGDGRR